MNIEQRIDEIASIIGIAKFDPEDRRKLVAVLVGIYTDAYLRGAKDERGGAVHVEQTISTVEPGSTVVGYRAP